MTTIPEETGERSRDSRSLAHKTRTFGGRDHYSRVLWLPIPKKLWSLPGGQGVQQIVALTRCLGYDVEGDMRAATFLPVNL
jgi:hypothetical protein